MVTRPGFGILVAVLNSPPCQEVFAPFGYCPRRLLAPACHDLHAWTRRLALLACCPCCSKPSAKPVPRRHPKRTGSQGRLERRMHWYGLCEVRPGSQTRQAATRSLTSRVAHNIQGVAEDALLAIQTICGNPLPARGPVRVTCNQMPDGFSFLHQDGSTIGVFVKPGAGRHLHLRTSTVDKVTSSQNAEYQCEAHAQEVRHEGGFPTSCRCFAERPPTLRRTDAQGLQGLQDEAPSDTAVLNVIELLLTLLRHV